MKNQEEPPGHPNVRLPPQEFQERLNFLQQEVNIKASMGVLVEKDTPSPGLIEFLDKMKVTPVSLLARFAQITGLPICNYYCFEVPDSKLYICVVEYENNQYYGAKKKNKKDAKNSAALNLLDFLHDSKKLLILDKKYAKAKEKELLPNSETRQLFDNMNPIPIVDCPPEFSNLREHIWTNFENEGLPDPIFCSETLNLFNLNNNQGSSMLNQHCNLNKVKSPDIIIFTAPTERNGKKYIGATVFEEKIFLGAISKSKSQAKNNCAAFVVDFLIRVGKFNLSRRQKRKMESGSVDEIFSKEGKLKRLHDLREETLNFLISEKTPTTLLNEISAKFKLPKTNFEVSQIEEGSFLFVAKAVFEDTEFISFPAPRKKDASNDAAILVLDHLFKTNKVRSDDPQMAKIQKLKQNPGSSKIPGFSQDIDIKDVKMEVDRDFEDEQEAELGHSSLFELGQLMIYDAIRGAYETEELMAHSSHHVSGIVCHNSNTNEAILISWATGNNFNPGTSERSSLKDCYAEILSRRGFLIYLMDEVKEYISSNGENSIFFLNDETKLLKIKEEYSFHLFISGAPIGDGCRISYNGNDFSNAIFPASDCYIGHGIGQLSVKRSGKDTVEPLTTSLNTGSMASSDKILKWNVCGIQGAALSHIMEPIYFSSISIEKNYDKKNLTRALIPPVNGLYMSLLAPLVYMFFGTSRTTSLGSFAIVALMVADVDKKIMKTHYPTNFSEIFEMEDYSHLEINPSTICSTLTFAVGILQLGAAILKFEYFSNLFTEALIGGFTVATAIQIFFTQIFDLLGVKASRGSGPFCLFLNILEFLKSVPKANLVTVGTSLVTGVILFTGKDYVSPVIKRWTKGRLIVPFELVVMTLGTLVSYIFDFRNAYGVIVVGKVPTGLPQPSLPVFSIVPECISYSIPITVLTVAMHMSMVKILAQRQKYTIDPGQEIYAISFASLISSFFPVFPNSNGFGRSFVQAECGAKTQICSLSSSLFLLGVIFFMGPLFNTLPRCVLSTSIWIVSCFATIIVDVVNGLYIALLFTLGTVVLRTQWLIFHKTL
ncbi:hypothetical protein FO519_005482 [Halicephalobus sp. NKZ332]|nr:hypothetical protein FO519_005482 [Halicephalobus sp. NKZ332]